jgi:AcrR family transcriptional regulator
MPTKGERTRADIISRSAELLNRQGFLATPVSDVIEATGIQKGGLYRHFESREALAIAALDYAVAGVRDRLLHATASRDNACDKLLAILDAYSGDGLNVPMAGGCPIMNTAIETDHAHPRLRKQAQRAMSEWHGLVTRIVEAGLRSGEIRQGVIAKHIATSFIACIEGGVMLTQLYGDPSYLNASRQHLADYVERELRNGKIVRGGVRA